MENTPTRPKALLNNYLPQSTSPQKKCDSPLSYKIKQIIKHKDVWRCIAPSDISSINKYKPKMLSHITVSRIRSQEIGKNGLRSLHKAIVDCKRACSLTFRSEDLNPKQIAHLIYSANHLKKFSFPDNSFQKVISALPRLGRCKNLESFSISSLLRVDPITWHPNAKLLPQNYRQLRQLNKLRSLFLNAPLLGGDILFNSHLPRGLRHIELVFISKTTFSEQELSGTLSSIQKCSQLEHLSLHFLRDESIEASEVQIWTSFFRNAPISLKKLTLHILGSFQQQPEIILSFIASLKYLKDLTSLDISGAFIQYSSDELFSSLFASLQPLTQLKTLKLSLHYFSGLGSDGLKNKSIKQLTLMLQDLKNLRSLEIDLPYLHSPNEGFVSISEGLKNLVHLKMLHFRLRKTYPSQESMQIFSNNIAHHHLTSLAVSDDYDAWQNSPVISTIESGAKKLASIWKTPSLAPFFSNIGKFVLLSNLDLRLSDFTISIQEWKHLSDQLKQLKELSSLSFILPKFGSKNNFEGFRSLFSSLQDLPKLVTLNLRFGKEICDQEINFLASHLIGCQNLKTLKLDFVKPSQLGDQSLYYLQSGIQALLTLEDLSISFWSWNLDRKSKKKPFGEKTMSEFLKGLIVLKNLETFFFDENFPHQQNNIPPPLNPKNYHKLRYLWTFNVNGSEFI